MATTSKHIGTENTSSSGGENRLGQSEKNMHEPVVVQAYPDFESCSFIREEWDKFIENISGEIFLTYDWCRVWWKHYGRARKLLILIFRCQGEIVGALPVFHERIWLGPLYAKVIKIVGTDFTPIAVIMPIKKEFLRPVLELFRICIDGEWNWDIVRFGAIAGMYGSITELADSVRDVFTGSHRIETKNEDVQIYHQFPENWEQYLKTLQGNGRKNARRVFKDLEKSEVSVLSRVVAAENLNESFDEFVQMHQAYWQTLFKPGHFNAWPRAYQFHREQANIHAERDRLRLLKITLNGRCVAYEYYYKFGKTYYGFINGRSADLYKSGLDFKWIPLRASLELGATEGVIRFDSMRGAYDYKLAMGVSSSLSEVSQLFRPEACGP